MEPLQAGDHLDNFEIKEILHAGSMACLYRAFDLLYRDEVVLKIPVTDILHNPIPYYHYQNEERISRYLNHPKVVRFLQRDRTRLYLVMEYVDGCDLRQLLDREKKRSFLTARALIFQVLDALEYLHSLSLAHLDLKPENVMITSDGELKLCDFGLSYHSGHLDMLAEDFKGPQGTPYYISPEQLCERHFDLRSDIYSVGIILYEMLTGELPFKRTKKLSGVRERLKKDPVPLRYYDQDILPELQEIVLRCLERDPEARYQSTVKMRQDLLSLHEVTITQRGRRTEKPSWWSAVFPIRGGVCLPHINKSVEEISQGSNRLVLGCIRDHDVSDLVIDRVKREVLTGGGEVTLLTVLDRVEDDELEKYANILEGEQFGERLDRYVTFLNRYDIDSIVRIRPGTDIASVIEKTAVQMRADVIVLGPPLPKTGVAGIFGGTILQKVLKKVSCNVVVAESVSPGHPPVFQQDTVLGAELLTEMDLFLMDTWVHHLNWLTELVSVLLKDPSSQPDLDQYSCSLGKWLVDVSLVPRWQELISFVSGSHSKFHDVAHQMACMARDGKVEDVRQLYLRRALPLVTDFKKSLEKMSIYLRQQKGKDSIPGA